MHKLLERQLRRCYGTPASVPPAVAPLAELVGQTYADIDDERVLVDRSISIASEELFQQHERLRQEHEVLEATHVELRDQTMVTETLFRIGQAIAGELDLQTLMQRVIDETTKVLRAQFGVVCCEGLQPGTAPLRATSGPVPATGMSFGEAVDVMAAALDPTSQSVRVDDATAPMDRACAPAAAAAAAVGARSLLVERLVSRGGQPLGTLTFGHPSPDAFAERDERILRGVAIQAAMAIDNARLFRAATEANERLVFQATYDSLTKLPNRVLFRERVQQAVEAAAAKPHLRSALMFIDLDRFKAVNDTMGHAAGDQLLVAVAERIRACVSGWSVANADARPFTIARIAGDEFTVLLGALTDDAQATETGGRLVKDLAAPYLIDGREIRISASIGIAICDRNSASTDHLLRDADTAMYEAKSQGKNCCVLFDAAIHESARGQLALEQDLRMAMERGEFSLRYQPIVSLTDRSVVGFEALVRWQRGETLVSPADFIPVAEELGLIDAIGLWVLREACRQLHEWTHRRPDRSNLTVSVNLSRRQLLDPSLIRNVRDVLGETGLAPARLKLEVTESMVMNDMEMSLQTLAGLREIGVGLHMDDFGTGYSSLAYLNALPIDGLKLDRTFLRDVAFQRDCIAVLQAMINLAHHLGMKVVAEGLEEPEQVALLQVLECDFAQGFYFAKPLVPADALAYLDLRPAASDEAARLVA